MTSRFDLIVVGGGVNGTGIARDASMRGLKTLLLEKDDFAHGASGANSRMIHGGVRYLFADRKVTELACIDSGYIQRIVPHLLYRIPFLVPLKAADPARPTPQERFVAYGSEVYIGIYDLYQPYKRGLPSVKLSSEEAFELEPGLKRDIVGAISMDEWGIDPWRLCVLNARSAQKHGADVRTYTAVTGFLRDEEGAVKGVTAEDRLTGERLRFESELVVNVTGAWAPSVAREAGVTVRMRPGKGVHLTIDRRLTNYGIIASAVDGRQMFVLPHENTTTIGTTDDDYYGDPDRLEVTEDEVAYLLEGAESVLPSIRNARVLRAWAGLRTTLFEYGAMEDDLSREHALFDHAEDGAPGLLTFIGGKLASFRVQSEEVTDEVMSRLGARAATTGRNGCRTHLEALPGGDGFPDVAALAARTGLPELTIGRMAARHGSEAERICADIEAEPELAATLCRCEQVTRGEARYCIRNESVRRAVDLKRRCHLGVGPCMGIRCAAQTAALFAGERQLSAREERDELRAMLDDGYRERRPVMDGEQLAQEELARGQNLMVAQLDSEVGG